MAPDAALIQPRSDSQAASFAVGSRVWIPDAEDAFVQGLVVAVEGDSVDLELEPHGERPADAKSHTKDVQRVRIPHPVGPFSLSRQSWVQGTAPWH